VNFLFPQSSVQPSQAFETSKLRPETTPYEAPARAFCWAGMHGAGMDGCICDEDGGGRRAGEYGGRD
jgi:hypothetical protein